MDRDLEKGTANPEPKANSIDPQISHHEQRMRDGELERELNSGDMMDHNIQSQDFATAPGPSSLAYARRPLVENPEADGPTSRTPSPVYGQGASTGSQPPSPVYGDHLSVESWNHNADEYRYDGIGVPRSPSPIYGQWRSRESQNGGEHDHVSGLRSSSPVYGRRPSIGSRGGNERENQHEFPAAPRPPSPVYGLRGSLEMDPPEGTDGLRILEKQITSSFSNGIRTSFAGKTSLPDTTRIPDPSSRVLTSEPPQERQPDFSWIVRHHNRHLVVPIKLEQPGKARKIAESVKELRLPWREKGPTQPGGWQREDPENSVRISIAELHRIRLRKLQCKLVNHAWYMKQFNKEPPAQTNLDGLAGDSTKTTTWEDDLQEYTKALQDYDYMTKCSALPRDYFLVSGERKVDDYVMREIIGVQPPPAAEQAAIPVVGPWEDVNQPIGGTRNENVGKSWMKSFRTRLAMAALGGTFLVGPMWLMVLLREQWVYTALVSTTVFVYAFGMFMSAWLEKPMDVLSGTAAYAAVLVVFVGLGQDSGSSQAVAGAMGAANSTVGG